jgi:ABC-type hemin transport system substrate-binding protein
MRGLIGILLAFVLMAGCEQRPQSSAGSGEPRIVAMSPAIGIMMKDLGLEGRIVGRHAWDMVLDPALPVCGDQAGLDYEALIATNPTHVVLEWGQRPLPDRLSRLAERHGWRVESYELLTLGDIVDTTRALEALFEVKEPISGRIAEGFAQRPPERFAGAGRILLMMSLDPPTVMGPGSAHHQLLERLGGRPAITEGRPHMYLDAETTANLSPDGVLLFMPRRRDAPPREPLTEQQIRQMLGRIAMLHIPAVERGRVVIIDHPLAMIPSTSLAEVGAEVERVLAVWSEGSHPLEGREAQER